MYARQCLGGTVAEVGPTLSPGSVTHHVLGRRVDVNLQQVVRLSFELEMGRVRAPFEDHL